MELGLRVLRQFHPEKMRLPVRGIFVGKTNSGKTYFARWLLAWLCGELEEVIVMKPTLKPNEFAGICKASHCIRGFDGELMEQIIDDRLSRVERGEHLGHLMFFIDDAIFDMKKTNSALAKAFTMGRHANISVFMIVQKFRLLAQAVRSNADYVFCSRVANIKEREAVWEEYAGLGKQDFLKMFDEVTKDYGVLVIDTLEANGFVYEWSKAPKKMPDFYVEKDVKNDRVCYEDLD